MYPETALIARLPMPELELARVCLALGSMGSGVQLAGGELESIMQTKDLNLESLGFYIERIMSAVKFEIAPKGVRWVAPFASFAYLLAPNGLWDVTFNLTLAAKQFLDVEGGFDLLLQTILQSLCLQSRYSQVLMDFLEIQKAEGMYDFNVDFTFLRTLFGCSQTKCSFEKLDERVLRRCQQELMVKTALRFDYAPAARHGQAVDVVHFHIEAIDAGKTSRENPHPRREEILREVSQSF